MLKSILVSVLVVSLFAVPVVAKSTDSAAKQVVPAGVELLKVPVFVGVYHAPVVVELRFLLSCVSLSVSL